MQFIESNESQQPPPALLILPLSLLPHTSFFVLPLGISTGHDLWFEAVHVQCNPAWLAHRGHFHPICGSSWISSLYWRARGCQICQLRTILPNPLLDFLRKTLLRGVQKYITEWVNEFVELQNLNEYFNLFNPLMDLKVWNMLLRYLHVVS